MHHHFVRVILCDVHHAMLAYSNFSTTRPGIRLMLTMPANTPIHRYVINLHRSGFSDTQFKIAAEGYQSC